jgi:vacuolar-type H+-ATPase subunit F/Vma7
VPVPRKAGQASGAGFMDDASTMRVCYIGDAVAAAGFAIAGVRVHSPAAQPDVVWELIVREREANDLLIVDADIVAGIGDRLEALLTAQPVPPILVVPALVGDAPYVDTSMAAARRALGLS